MTQLAIGVAALNHDSKFAAAYERGIPKTEYWIYALEDSLDLVAKLPILAARIYSNVYGDGAALPALDKDADLVGMFYIYIPHSSVTTLVTYCFPETDGGSIQGTMSSCLGTATTTA